MTNTIEELSKHEYVLVSKEWFDSEETVYLWKIRKESTKIWLEIEVLWSSKRLPDTTKQSLSSSILNRYSILRYFDEFPKEFLI